MSDPTFTAPDTVLLAAGTEPRRLGLQRALALALPRPALLVVPDAARALAEVVAHPLSAVVIAEPLPDAGGVDLLGDLGARAPGVPVLLLADPPSAEAAAGALGLGAADYLDWSELSLAKLPHVLSRATKRRAAPTPSLLSTIAHDLRAPLTGLLGLIDLMESGVDGALQPAQIARLSRMRTTAGRLASLASDLSELGRIETGRLDVALVSQDLPEALERVRRELEPVLHARGVQVTLDVQPDLPPVQAEPSRLRRMLANLVSSLAARVEGSSLTLAAHLRGGSVELVVAESARALPVEAAFRELEPPTGSAGSGAWRQPGGDLSLRLACGLADLQGGSLRLGDSAAGASLATLTLRAAGAPPRSRLQPGTAARPLTR